jgi:DNA polymerase alpha subunit B
MYIACGPYTLDADLSYKPWHAFLKTIKTNKPAVVLLVDSISAVVCLSNHLSGFKTGPFIDIAHPKIKNGDVDATPSSLFRKQFLEPLRSFLESSPGSIVLILPSVRDVISRQAVFPQSELGPEYRVDPVGVALLPALFYSRDSVI